MKMRIFSLALGVGFLILFSVSAIFVYRYSRSKPESSVPESEGQNYVSADSAVFLLVFEDEGEYGPFSLVALDVEHGRIPVFSFSGKTEMNYSGISLSAAELFSMTSEKVFAGAVEKELNIDIDGYFVWDKESAEALISKSGGFDYVLPESLVYTDGNRYINLSAGVQSMTSKKFTDIVTFPKFTETERCDTLSRMLAEFLRRRLRRFLPENGNLSSVLYRVAKSDINALEREEYISAINEILSTGKVSSSHVTCDVLKDTSTGLFSFAEETLSRVEKYFRFD